MVCQGGISPSTYTCSKCRRQMRCCNTSFTTSRFLLTSTTVLVPEHQRRGGRNHDLLQGLRSSFRRLPRRRALVPLCAQHGFGYVREQSLSLHHNAHTHTRIHAHTRTHSDTTPWIVARAVCDAYLLLGLCQGVPTYFLPPCMSSSLSPAPVPNTLLPGGNAPLGALVRRRECLTRSSAWRAPEPLRSSGRLSS